MIPFTANFRICNDSVRVIARSNLIQVPPLDACEEMTSCDASCQEVGMCNIKDGSRGMYITFASTMQKWQPTLALKTREDITRYPKQATSDPKNRTYVCVRPQKIKQNYIFIRLNLGSWIFWRRMEDVLVTVG